MPYGNKKDQPSRGRWGTHLLTVLSVGLQTDVYSCFLYQTALLLFSIVFVHHDNVWTVEHIYHFTCAAGVGDIKQVGVNTYYCGVALVFMDLDV